MHLIELFEFAGLPLRPGGQGFELASGEVIESLFLIRSDIGLDSIDEDASCRWRQKKGKVKVGKAMCSNSTKSVFFVGIGNVRLEQVAVEEGLAKVLGMKALFRSEDNGEVRGFVSEELLKSLDGIVFGKDGLVVDVGDIGTTDLVAGSHGIFQFE